MYIIVNRSRDLTHFEHGGHLSRLSVFFSCFLFRAIFVFLFCFFVFCHVFIMVTCKQQLSKRTSSDLSDVKNDKFCSIYEMYETKIHQ